MPQDDPPNRVEREPEEMGDGSLGWLREALLYTPPGAAVELSQLLQSLRDQADEALVIRSADLLGIGLTDPMDIHVATVHAYSDFHGGTIFFPLDRIPSPSNSLARQAAMGAIADTERANPGLFNRMMRGDQAAEQQFQDAVDAAVADPRPRNVTPPVESGITEDTLRVTGACRPIRICFWPAAKFRRQPLRREYERQLALQQRGLNRMAPADVVANRTAYCSLPPGTRGIADPSQAAARRAYQAAYTRRLATRDRALRGKARILAAATRPLRVRRHMRTVAALHNPDRIAGGNSTVVYGPTDLAATLAGRPASSIGHRGVNSSIGSSWGTCSNASSRSSRLQAHAERQANAGCPSVQASLEICQN